ncbi:LacI family DNA-binding transcriptional regulator [Microlunatus sp. Gsoil 973]|uniref:LacI family DNA-binding transcriptional regulator n=1 Tax=Microlunatus sp. Gsoil 973 TaxID=2672569 RepID=UPI0018A811D9|nr:LacI family DNA-binding transcriptional regulator [Microlunatus sp. Gsoil 973]
MAELARVSRQTVTRAMNDMDGISAETRQRVLEAARTLGYHPSRFGRGLVRHDHHTLGLVISNLLNPYYPEFASAVVARAAERDWNVVLLDCNGAEHERTMITRMADQVDALIGYIHLGREELDRRMPGVPVVWVDAAGKRDHPNGVVFDLRPGLQAAVDQLLAHGVQHPVMLDTRSHDGPSDRAREFVRIMADHAVRARHVHAGGDQLQDGIEATGKIIQDLPKTDAIMCFNDIMAFGALKALRLQGRDVPGDVRVIGIDGLAAGTYVTPQLTSLALDMTDVAAAAVDIALGRLDGSIPDSSRRARRKVRHRLVIRESG